MTYTGFKLLMELCGTPAAPVVIDEKDRDIERYARLRSAEAIEDIFLGSRAELSRKIGIPLRTLDRWALKEENPPQYVLDLLAYAVITEKYHR